MRMFLFLVVLAAAVVFVATNTDVVTVNFFAWSVDASLAVVVFISLAAGFLMGFLTLAPGFLRRRAQARSHARALEETARERDTLAERSAVLEDQVKQLAPMENNPLKDT